MGNVQRPRLVLGIDPGTQRLGWGVVRLQGASEAWVASGVLRPPLRDDRPQRLGMLLIELQALLATHQPDFLAIESAFVRRDARAALAIGEARGVALALATSRGMAVIELSPSAIKRSVVGSGRATKSQVQELVRLQLRLPALPAEDEADALAAALTGARQIDLPAARLPRSAKLPAVDAAAMTSGRAYYAGLVAAARARGRR